MVEETLVADRAANIATEILSKVAILPHLPQFPLLGLAHTDTMDGANSGKKNYRVQKDNGPSSAGDPTTDLSVTHVLGTGTTLGVTPTSGVGSRADLAENMIQQENGLTADQVNALVHSTDFRDWLPILAPFVGDLIKMGLEKIHDDGLALIKASATNVGGGDGALLTVLNMLQAQHTLFKNNPLRPISEARYLMAPFQIQNIKTEIMASAGGFGGAVWGNQADFSMANMPPDGMFGLANMIGTFLGQPVHMIPEDSKVVATSILYGSYGIFGVPGVAPDDPSLGGACGAFVLLEEMPLRVAGDYSVTGRTVRLVSEARYLWKEVDDKSAVGLKSDEE